MPAVAVTRAEFGDVARLARVVAAAVFDLPVSAFLIPDEDDRRRVSAEAARLVYLWPALAGGIVWCTADRMAVAGWLRHNPGQAYEPHPQAAAELRRLVGRWYPRFQRLAEMLHEAHAPLLHLPHDRLSVLAVHPDRQHRGGGTALLAAYHEHLDAIGRPAYLEAAGPELVGFYARLGYTEIGEVIRLPNRATLHPMWRPPTPPADDAAPVDIEGQEGWAMDRMPSAPADSLTVVGGPMSREVAHWYLELTDGQFQACEHANGRWYLYLPKPTEVVADAARRPT